MKALIVSHRHTRPTLYWSRFYWSFSCVNCQPLGRNASLTSSPNDLECTFMTPWLTQRIDFALPNAFDLIKKQTALSSKEQDTRQDGGTAESHLLRTLEEQATFEICTLHFRHHHSATLSVSQNSARMRCVKKTQWQQNRQSEINTERKRARERKVKQKRCSYCFAFSSVCLCVCVWFLQHVPHNPPWV